MALLSNPEPVVMGILNVTPDSFSDGGEYGSVEVAVEHALKMQDAGAAMVDIGGESTRPGASPVGVQQELERVIPVIEALRLRSDILVSIDTSKPEVMREAVLAGASLVNDVNALRAEGAIETCAELEVPVCLMHMQGEPRTMQQSPSYDDVIVDIRDFLLERAELCIQSGISKNRILIDPGFGFGKSLEHNLSLLSRLDELCKLDFPLLVGISRKSVIGAVLDRDVANRVTGSVAAAVIAHGKGARWFRVHDVEQTCDALKICEAVNNYE